MSPKFNFFSSKSLDKRNLFLHVGMHKTGTTYIQDFLFKNRYNLLEKEGVLYPITKYHPLGQQRLAYAFNDAVNPHLPKDAATENIDVFEELKSLLNAEPHNTLIISSENISPSGNTGVIKKIKRFFEGYNIKIILYVRRQDKFIQSLYREHVKLPNSETKKFVDFKSPYPLDYNQVIGSWERLFGRSNVIVKSYDLLLQSQGGLLEDFLNTIGVSGVYPGPDKKSNEALPNIALELIRSANNIDLEHHERGRLNTKIRDFCNQYGYNSTWDLDPQPGKILENYKKSNLLLSEVYFQGSNVFNSTLDVSASKRFPPTEINAHLIFEQLHCFLKKNGLDTRFSIGYLIDEINREFEIQ